MRARLGKISVLVVGADPESSSATRRLLDRCVDQSFSVVATASNPPLALESARELQPEAAVVDLAMPGVSALDLIRGLRGLLPKSAIIAIAADVGGAVSRPALKVGADAFVPKRELEAALIPALLRAVDARLGPERSAFEREG